MYSEENKNKKNTWRGNTYLRTWKKEIQKKVENTCEEGGSPKT